MNTSPMTRMLNLAGTRQWLSYLPPAGMHQRRLPLALLIVVCALLAGAGVSRANGIAVQVFLDHIPVKTTWSPADGGRGVAVISANDEQVRVMAQNLPVPPSGASYYAWLEQANGQFLPVGALIYQSDGTASLDQPMPGLPYSENFSWVLISVEAAGAVGAQPSADVALAGRLPNADALPLTGNQSPQLLPVTGGNHAANPSIALPVLLFLVLLCIVGMILALRIYARQKPYASSQIRAHNPASGQKHEKRQ